MKSTLLCLALLALIVSGAQAQITSPPPLMNFQGRLAKPDGTPVNDGTYNLIYGIYDTQTVGTGTLRWTQTVTGVAVHNGVFAVLLNLSSGLQMGQTLDTLFNGTPYLQLQINSDPPLAPRQPLVSVAYAFKANSVPDGAITVAKIADGSITPAKISSAGAASGQSLTFNGSSVVWGAPRASDLTLPFAGSATSTGNLFSITNFGSGPTAAAIAGYCDNGTGLFGSGGTQGVYGYNTTPTGYGVTGFNTTGTGVYGNGGNYGVVGASGSTGVFGTSGDTGVYGFGNTHYGVYGISSTGTGVYGISNSSSGYGVYGENTGGSSSYAGYFNGNAKVTGNLSVTGSLSKGGGSFKIDHPLDPANKYLYHSFVESPDMMNIYNGVVRLDARGNATVALPTWFQSLNRDFRYQLTAIGAPGPNLYVAEEIKNNRFRIAGGTPSAKVSWQVTGVRQDAYANAHRIPIEEEKPAQERGTYLYPQEQGQPEKLGIDYARQRKMAHTLPPPAAPATPGAPATRTAPTAPTDSTTSTDSTRSQK